MKQKLDSFQLSFGAGLVSGSIIYFADKTSAIFFSNHIGIIETDISWQIISFVGLLSEFAFTVGLASLPVAGIFLIYLFILTKSVK